MAFSYTGLSYLFLFIASAFLAYRFFQYWQRIRDRISKLLFLFTFPLVLFVFLTAIGGLFFADNTQILFLTVISGAPLQGIAFGILLYTLIYLKFPQISPWIGFFLIFIFGILGAIFLPETNPTLDRGLIDWGVSFSLDYVILRILIFLPLVGFSFVLYEQYKTSEDPMVRTRALGLALLFIFAIGIGILDFLARNLFIRDIGYMVLSVGLIIVIVITQKPSKIQ